VISAHLQVSPYDDNGRRVDEDRETFFILIVRRPPALHIVVHVHVLINDSRASLLAKHAIKAGKFEYKFSYDGSRFYSLD
jgi:hypothetical protein